MCVYIYIYIYIYAHICIHMCTHIFSQVGELNLSCDVVVASHLSHQVIVFERAHRNKQSYDWKLPQTHHIT